MDFFSSGDGISQLTNLLKESEEAQNAISSSNQQTVAPIALNSTNVVHGAKKKTTNSKDIWNDDEIPTEDMLLACNPSKSLPQPKYEFRYKQTVGTEETYFGLSDVTPASYDCTHLVIKIHFPNSKMRDLDLDVTKNRIKAESRYHRLFTYLPVNVFHEQGNAKFDTKKEVLTITLPIDNESLDS